MINVGGKNVSKHISDIKTDVSSRGIDVMAYPYNAKGDGVTDDTQAFKDALAVSNNIWVPAGTFIISDTLNINHYTTIRGVYKKSILKFTKDNDTMFMASQPIDGATGFNYGIMENFDIQGLGKTFNQVGINVKGFLCEFKNIGVRDFNHGMDLRGVHVSLRECYFVSNANGVVIQDNITSGGALTFNTLIHLNRCYFSYNTMGISNIGDGQTFNGAKENVIDLALERCVFDFNTQAFNLRPSKGVMKECWFEMNTNRPTTRKFGWVFDNNRYESSGGIDQTIDYISITSSGSDFSGIVEMEGKRGIFSPRTIDFQRYNSSGIDVSTKQLEEESISSLPAQLSVMDSVDATTRALLELNPVTAGGTTAKLFNKVSHISLKPDGTVYFNGVDVKHTGFAASKLATGRYKVIIHSSMIQAVPHVFVASPTAVNGDTLQDTFYCATHGGNTSDLTAYANTGYLTTLYIDVYKKPSAGGADVLADAWVHITLYHA